MSNNYLPPPNADLRLDQVRCRRHWLLRFGFPISFQNLAESGE